MKILNKISNKLSSITNDLLFSIYTLKYNIKIGNQFCIHGKLDFQAYKTSVLKIGNNFYFSNARKLNPICRNIRGSIKIEPNATIIIGNNVAISSACLWAHKKITIGNNVKIGGDCIIIDSDCHSLYYLDRHDVNTDIARKKNKEIQIEDDVMIGARCIILKGVTIGARSIIGAGSIVTKSIPSDCIACGNPAKIIKHI